MNQKSKKILKGIPAIFISLVITMSAIMKLVAMPQLVEIYSRVGVLDYMKILGSIELLFVALFLISRTMRLGFLLLTAYFGGAMAVELSHGNLFIFPAVILTVLWIAAFFRDPSIFTSFQNQRQAFQA